MGQECERTWMAGPHSISAGCRALVVRRVVGRRSRRASPGAVAFAAVSSSQFEDSPGSRRSGQARLHRKSPFQEGGGEEEVGGGALSVGDHW